MSKKIKPEELQDLTTEELKEVVVGAIVEILGDELIIVETPELAKLEQPVFYNSDAKAKPFKDKVFEFSGRGYNHNAIGAMMGIDSDLVKEILDAGR